MDNGASSYRRFLDGDDSAFVEIIKLYKDGLILYLESFTHNVFTAEDLMEDTFLRIVIKRPYFNGKSSFKTFLYSIARNIAIDYLRKNSKERAVSLDEALNTVAAEDLEREYFIGERRIAVHKAISKLNERYAQVLYLSYLENFTNEETGKIMKKSKRQVENLLYRAKSALKAELEKDGFIYEEL